MPEARALAAGGPFRRNRQPLNLAGLVTSLGALLHFQQPWAGLVVLFNFSIQLFRVHFKEQVLTRALPEYAEYATRTWQPIPGVY